MGIAELGVPFGGRIFADRIPIALILAWAYDVTPQGIRATKKTAAETHLRRNMIILIATSVIVSAAAGFFLLPRASARKIDKSIAVLPFQNLSGEKENWIGLKGEKYKIPTPTADREASA